MKIKNFLIGALVSLTGLTGLASCKVPIDEDVVLTAAKQSPKYETSLNSKNEDVVKPTILGPDQLRFGYSAPSTLEAILGQYTATDDIDESVEIVVAEENYIANRRTIGNYTIKLQATDSSGNVGEKIVPVTVYDSVAPLFNAPSKIYKSTSIALTTKDIHKEVTATDAIDGEVKVETIEDNYTGKANEEGTYTIKYSASDKSNNISKYTLPVQVLGGKFPNVWYSHGNMIHVQSNVQLTVEDVVNVFLASEELKTEYSKVEVVASGYTFKTALNEEAENAVGTYTISINARYYTGEEISFSRSLEVYDSDELIHGKDAWYNVAWKSVYNHFARHIINVFVYLQNGISELFVHPEWKWDLFEPIVIYK